MMSKNLLKLTNTTLIQKVRESRRSTSMEITLAERLDEACNEIESMMKDMTPLPEIDSGADT